MQIETKLTSKNKLTHSYKTQPHAHKRRSPKTCTHAYIQSTNKWTIHESINQPNNQSCKHTKTEFQHTHTHTHTHTQTNTHTHTHTKTSTYTYTYNHTQRIQTRAHIHSFLVHMSTKHLGISHGRRGQTHNKSLDELVPSQGRASEILFRSIPAPVCCLLTTRPTTWTSSAATKNKPRDGTNL